MSLVNYSPVIFRVQIEEVPKVGEPNRSVNHWMFRGDNRLVFCRREANDSVNGKLWHGSTVRKKTDRCSFYGLGEHRSVSFWTSLHRHLLGHTVVGWSWTKGRKKLGSWNDIVQEKSNPVFTPDCWRWVGLLFDDSVGSNLFSRGRNGNRAGSTWFGCENKKVSTP